MPNPRRDCKSIRGGWCYVLRVPLNVTDPDTALTELVFVATTGNGTAVVQSVTFDSTSISVTAVITLRAGAATGASDTVTVRVIEGECIASQSFTVTIGAAQSPCPTLGAIGNQSGAAGATLRVPLNVTDSDTALTELIFVATTGNGTAVVQSVTFDQTSASVTAVITLQAGAANGASDTVTIRVSDGECIASQTFTVTVGTQPPAATLAASRQGTNFVLNVTGQAGSTYAIEASADLRSWTQIGTVVIEADGTTTVTIPATGPYRFFRTRGGPAPAPAQALAYEGYEYPAGTTISTNQNGGTGWTAGWTPDVETPTNHVVVAPGLEYGDGVLALVTSPGSVFYTATTNNVPAGGTVHILPNNFGRSSEYGNDLD